VLMSDTRISVSGDLDYYYRCIYVCYIASPFKYVLSLKHNLEKTIFFLACNAFT
jgi:hypothetical protein